MDSSQTRLIVSSILAPYKVLLLALVAAYCLGILPKKSNASLLALMVKIIEQHPLVDDEPISVDIPVLELLEMIRKAVMGNYDNNSQKNSEDNKQIADEFDTIQSRLLNAIWSMKNLDDLHQFITKSNSLLVNTAAEGKELLADFPKDILLKKLLTKRSFLGKFVLSCIKDLESLEFKETQNFWHCFVEYRQPSLKLFQSYNKSNNNAFGSSLTTFVGKSDDNDNHNFGEDPQLNLLIQRIKKNTFFADIPGVSPLSSLENLKVVSGIDLQRAVSKQIRLLESFGTPTTDSLRETLELVAKQGNNVFPSSYYLMYLESINTGDYEGAFKYLHGYFDYMMSNSSQSYYQYALLSLATLHAKFNSNQQALEAIKEAILVARENNDNGCLNYLLSWLFNFLKNRPELKHDFFESNEQLLGFLKNKTNTQNSDNIDNMTETDLNSKAYEMEATQIILDGGPLSKILEAIIKSEYLALNDDYDNGSFIINCLLQSSLWSRTGVCELAELFVSIAMDASKSQHNIGNINYRLAWLEYENGEMSRVKNIIEGSDTTNEMMDQTTEVIRSALAVKKLIHGNDLAGAKYQLLKLKEEQKLRSDIDIRNEIIYLHSVIEYKLGNYDNAMRIVSEEIKKNEKIPSLFSNYWYIKFSIMYCKIGSLGDNNGVRVLPRINEMIKLGQKSGLVSLVNELILILASILIKMRKLQQSYDLVQSYMPQILQYSNLMTKSDAYYLLSEIYCELLINGYFKHVDGQQVMQTVDNFLKIAGQGYVKFNDVIGLDNCSQLLKKFHGKVLEGRYFS